ncbi:MAG: hypothetical protein QOE40_1779 [Actinomycetota bacterium]|nr:hypothetical protein [Actinomycetota bacterium]
MSESDALREGLKRVAVALKETEVPFALAGGYAAWALGGPEPDHDVDFLVHPEDVGNVKEELTRRGLEVEQPPEDWLFKVYVGDAMVDVIHHLGADPVSAAAMQGTESLEVLSVRMPVLSATDLITHKLRALDEHQCDFARLLPVARALREQVAWDEVQAWARANNDFALAFLFLLQRLEVLDGAAAEDTTGSVNR